MCNGDSGDINLHAMVFAPSGTDRLCVYHVTCEDQPGGLDFHSLAWETRAEDGWRITARISRNQFQGTHGYRRWVSELDSLDPKQGCAIIQVGEADRPESENAFKVLYSWRRWNLLANTEVERLQDCENPFEPYRPMDGEDG